MIQIIGKNGKLLTLRGLFDSGCSKSIILKKFTYKEQRRRLANRNRTTYQTYGGEFTSKSEADVEFRMVEFSNSKRVEFTVQVDEVMDPNHAQYDFIMGANIMSTIGINIKFSTSEIYWGDIVIPKTGKFKSATALDLSQGYYSIPIDEESWELCTTVLPWGTIRIQAITHGSCFCTRYLPAHHGRPIGSSRICTSLY